MAFSMMQAAAQVRVVIKSFWHGDDAAPTEARRLCSEATTLVATAVAMLARAGDLASAGVGATTRANSDGEGGQKV